jgi:hypothetical protein
MDGIEQLLQAAEQHGEDEGYEAWVGDLEQLPPAAIRRDPGAAARW